MHPTEFHWLYEARRPRQMYGDLTEQDVEAIYQAAYGEDE